MAKSKGKKKSKKDKKGKKRVPRSLPTPVKGLLQYLGGQDATLQGSRPRGATPSDVGETLSRYLSAKTAMLDLQKQQVLGINLAQQTEEKLLAKRQAEEAEKKISMLSAGLKETDTERKKAIAEQKAKLENLESLGLKEIAKQSSKIAEVEGVLRQQGVETLFKSMREGRTTFRYPSSQVVSKASRVSRFSQQEGSDVGFVTEEEGGDFQSGDPNMYSADFGTGGGGAFAGGGGAFAGGGSVASELYMENAPTGRPVIRDRPRREPRASAGGGVALPRRVKAPAEPKVKTGITAEQLRNRISETTGIARKKYKLPPRRQYATVMSALERQSASPADLISALKEAGVNIAET
jgi:hypothetical protein